MKIKLKNCEEFLAGWYTIVRAEHDGREWSEERKPGYLYHCMSERLEPTACIEGEGWEILELAKAIKARSYVSFKRCAVRAHLEIGVYLCSPKNSQTETLISFEDADEFANEVFALLGDSK
jgi:hypothetical protein